MDAPSANVEVPVETRVGASAEIGGDDEGGWFGARTYLAHDIAERIALGTELAWAPRASSSWSSIDTPSLRDRSKGRALAFVALRTRPAQAEGAIAFGFGLNGERRKEDLPDGSTRWLALEPSLLAGSWVTGRIWLVSRVAIEIEAGLLAGREPRRYGGSDHRIILSPLMRSGLVVRF